MSTSPLAAPIENVRVGILVEDESRRVTQANQDLCTMFGILAQPHTLIGTDCSKFTDEVKGLFDAPERFASRIEELLREGRVVTGQELRLIDGRTFERDFTPIFLEGDHRAHLWQYRDITDRKWAEEELRRSEERLQATFEQAAVGIAHTDIEGRSLRVNRRLCELLGYTEEELLNLTFQDITHPDHLPTDFEYIRQLLAGDIESFTAERRYIRKDGSHVWVDLTVSLVCRAPGEPEYFIAVVEDISERKRAYEQLTESARRFTTLLSNTPAMVYRCLNEPGWPMEFASDYAEELTGCTPQEFMDGRVSFADLIVERDRERVWDEVQAAIAKREPFRLDYQIRNRNGAMRYVEEHGQAIYGQDGRLLALEGLISDITQRKEAEKRTAAFSTLGQLLSEATTASSAARIIAEVSDELLGWDAFALLLYSVEEDLLYPVLDFDTVDGWRTKSPAGGSAVSTGGPVVSPSPVSRRAMTEGPQLLLPEQPSVELEGLRSFGDTGRPSASLMFVPIRGAGGVIGILSIQSYTYRAYTEADLATLQVLADHCGGALERIRTEEVLRESEERFRVLFEHSPEAILLIDPHDPDAPWKIADCNDAAIRVYGYSREELIGQPIDRMFTEQYGADVWVGYLGEIRREHMLELESERRRKDGRAFPVESSLSLIVLEGREMVLSIDRDITERRRAELVAQAEHAVRLRNEFLSIASHELKTPVTLVRGYAQVLYERARQQGDEGILRLLNVIDRQVRRMSRLIDELLDVSSTESGRLEFEMVPFDLAEATEEVVGEVAAGAPKYALRLDREAHELWVLGDRGRIQQVVTNLLTNAIKYSEEQKEVDVRVRREGDRAVVAVTDRGIGIPEGEREKVFALYFRASNAPASNYGGLGLGLYISKTIVERHGGEISVEPEDGKGSTFHFSLPVLSGDRPVAVVDTGEGR